MTEMLGASPLIRAIGVALVEFLWQGALLLGVARGVLFVMRRSSASARYAAACAVLGAMAAAPVLTAWSAYAPDRRPVGVGAETVAAAVEGTSGAGTLATTFVSDAWLLPVVLVWTVGVLLLAAQLAVGWFGIGRMRRSGIHLSPDRQRDLLALAGRVGVARLVRLVESARVAVPTVIGWVRPVILLPTSTLSGLSPEQLEAILIHELAHVRRHDYLVNIGQSVVETLLFYHPGVWWLSKRIRAERELCCDDLVMTFGADRVVYARALASLEEQRVHAPVLSLAADGGDLVGRIRRLLGAAPIERPRPVAAVVAALIVALPLLFVGEMRGSAAEPRTLPIPGRTTEALSGGAQPDASRSAVVVEGLNALRARLDTAGQTPPPTPPPPAPPPPAATGTTVTPAGATTIESMLEEARRHIDAGRYSEALRLLNEVTALLPQAPASTAPAQPPPGGPVRTPARPDAGLAAPVRVGGAVQPPVKIHDVRPAYPQDARDAGVQGLVIIEAVIDEDGHVLDTTILRGSPMLNDAAVAAVSQWRYTPPTLNGSPVSIIMTVTVNFTLSN